MEPDHALAPKSVSHIPSICSMCCMLDIGTANRLGEALKVCALQILKVGMNMCNIHR